MTHSFPTRRASDLDAARVAAAEGDDRAGADRNGDRDPLVRPGWAGGSGGWAYKLWRRALFHDDHDHDGRLWRHLHGAAQGAHVRHHCWTAAPSFILALLSRERFRLTLTKGLQPPADE